MQWRAVFRKVVTGLTPWSDRTRHADEADAELDALRLRAVELRKASNAEIREAYRALGERVGGRAR